MVVCEICGRNGQLLTAEIESVELRVCPNCAKYGTLKQGGWQNNGPDKYSKHISTKAKPVNEKPEFKLIDNFSDKLKSARDSRSMTQKDFSNLINERESISSKWERGELVPSIETARKLEKILGLILIIKDENKTENIQVDRKKNELTLGDFIKVRKRN